MPKNHNSIKRNRYIQSVLYLFSGANCLLFALLNAGVGVDAQRIVIGMGVLLLLFSPLSILDRRKGMCGAGATISVFFVSLFCSIFTFVLCGMQNAPLLCLYIPELIVLVIVWQHNS